MASFPSSIPAYNGFTSTHTLSQDTHAAQHNAEQGDIVALAQKLGTGASTPIINTLLRGNGIGTTTYDQVHLTTDVSGVLAAGNGGTGQNSLTALPLVAPAITGGGTWAGAPTLNGPTISDFSNANHGHQNGAGGGTINGGSAIQAGTLTGDRLAANTVTPDKMLGIDMFAVGGGLTGPTPPAGTGQFYLQAGSSVITLFGNNGTVTYPTPFPNGVLSVVCVQGDSSAGFNAITVTAETLSGFNVSITAGGNSGIRINWIAIGS